MSIRPIGYERGMLSSTSIRLLVASSACAIVAAIGCSSSNSDEDTSADASVETNDAAAALGDASATTESGADAQSGTDASIPAPSGTLEIKAAGTTTATVGTFTPTSGSAQWRARPMAGGVLTVSLGDATRSVEVSVYDDTGTTIDANESFNADAPAGFALHKVRVETYEAATGWATAGDGAVSVTSISATSVTLAFNNIGQFGIAAPTDAFTLSGTVTVPVVSLSATNTGSASLTIANVQNEPISNEAPNFAGQTTAFTTTAVALGEASYPYLGDQRAASFVQTVDGIKRNIRVRFPSGHLPRVGQSINLSKFDRVEVSYFEGDALTETTDKFWQADMGTLAASSNAAGTLTLELTAARLQSEAPGAKGLFEVTGTITFAVP